MQLHSTRTVQWFESRSSVLRQRGPSILCLGLWLCAAAIFHGHAATNQASKMDRGYTYVHHELRDIPWSVHVVKIDRTRPEMEIHTAIAKGTTLGMAAVSDQVRLLPPSIGKPVAAINGDFFHSSRYYLGDPVGLQISQGELVSEPSLTRPCVWIDAKGNPHLTNVLSQFSVTWPNGTNMPFGLNKERESDEVALYTAVVGESTRTYRGVDVVLERSGEGPWLPLQIGQTYKGRVRAVQPNGDANLGRDVMVLSIPPALLPEIGKVVTGAVVRITTATIPSLAGARTGIGGGPALVHEGKALPMSDLRGRHPRTAVGWNKDFVFFVEVDGRQRNLSLGMTFSELAGYMAKLGCQEAMNLDGGGSATMWVLGNVISSPSEGRERPAPNALVLTRKEKP